jgi:uncharacterized MAPEG superfamily protein
MTQYADSIFIIAIIITTVVIQALVAARAHRKQEHYIPGVVAAELDHHSYVFRTNRTFMNSLENVPLFVVTALLAMFAGVDANTLYVVTTVFATARIVHMALFYKIATNENPSPRSYFYLIGLLTQMVLLGLIFAA